MRSITTTTNAAILENLQLFERSECIAILSRYTTLGEQDPELCLKRVEDTAELSPARGMPRIEAERGILGRKSTKLAVVWEWVPEAAMAVVAAGKTGPIPFWE